MLLESDPIRRLPVFVDAVDRVRMEALLFSADIMSLALGRIEATVRTIPWGPSKIPFVIQRQLFSDAWAIVDQLHVARELLTPKALQNIGEIARNWHADASATLLRNGMDHLPKNAGNLAKKAKANPLFGGLTIFRLKDLQASPLEYQLITVYAGTNGNVSKYNMTIPKDMSHPIASVELSAFDQKLNLAFAVRTFKPVLLAAADLARAQIADFVKDNGYTPEAVEAARLDLDLFPFTTILEGTVSGT